MSTPPARSDSDTRGRNRSLQPQPHPDERLGEGKRARLQRGKVLLWSPNPPKTSAHTLTHLNGKLYLIGGRNSSSSSGGGGLPAVERISVWRLDLAERERGWALIEPDPGGPGQRWGHSVCAADGKRLFLFGGFDHQCNYGDGWFLDTDTCRWAKAALRGDKVHYRAYHTAVCVGGRIVLFGGCYCECGAYAHFNDLHTLDLRTMAWRRVRVRNPEKAPSPRSQHTAVLTGRQMIIIGGYDGRNVFGDVHILDLDKKAWTHLSTIGTTLPAATGLHPRPFKIFPARRDAVVQGSLVIVVGNIKRFDETEPLRLHVLDLKKGRRKTDLSPSELIEALSSNNSPKTMLRLGQIQMKGRRRRSKGSRITTPGGPSSSPHSNSSPSISRHASCPLPLPHSSSSNNNNDNNNDNNNNNNDDDGDNLGLAPAAVKDKARARQREGKPPPPPPAFNSPGELSGRVFRWERVRVEAGPAGKSAVCSPDNHSVALVGSSLYVAQSFSTFNRKDQKAGPNSAESSLSAHASQSASAALFAPRRRLRLTHIELHRRRRRPRPRPRENKRGQGQGQRQEQEHHPGPKGEDPVLAARVAANPRPGVNVRAVSHTCALRLVRDMDRLFSSLWADVGHQQQQWKASSSASLSSLRVGDRVFTVHKALLMKRSSFFSGMWSSRMMESQAQSAPIEIKGVPSVESFTDMLRYIYTGKLSFLGEEEDPSFPPSSTQPLLSSSSPPSPPPSSPPPPSSSSPSSDVRIAEVLKLADQFGIPSLKALCECAAAHRMCKNSISLWISVSLMIRASILAEECARFLSFLPRKQYSRILRAIPILKADQAIKRQFERAIAGFRRSRDAGGAHGSGGGREDSGNSFPDQKAAVGAGAGRDANVTGRRQRRRRRGSGRRQPQPQPQPQPQEEKEENAANAAEAAERGQNSGRRRMRRTSGAGEPGASGGGDAKDIRRAPPLFPYACDADGAEGTPPARPRCRSDCWGGGGGRGGPGGGGPFGGDDDYAAYHSRYYEHKGSRPAARRRRRSTSAGGRNDSSSSSPFRPFFFSPDFFDFSISVRSKLHPHPNPHKASQSFEPISSLTPTHLRLGSRAKLLKDLESMARAVQAMDGGAGAGAEPKSDGAGRHLSHQAHSPCPDVVIRVVPSATGGSPSTQREGSQESKSGEGGRRAAEGEKRQEHVSAVFRTNQWIMEARGCQLFSKGREDHNGTSGEGTALANEKRDLRSESLGDDESHSGGPHNGARLVFDPPKWKAISALEVEELLAERTNKTNFERGVRTKTAAEDADDNGDEEDTKELGGAMPPVPPLDLGKSAVDGKEEGEASSEGRPSTPALVPRMAKYASSPVETLTPLLTSDGLDRKRMPESPEENVSSVVHQSLDESDHDSDHDYGSKSQETCTIHRPYHRGSKKGDKGVSVTIRGVDSCSVDEFLLYIHTGYLRCMEPRYEESAAGQRRLRMESPDPKHMMQMLQIAGYFGFEDFHDIVERRLSALVDVTTAVSFARTAMQLKMPSLLNLCVDLLVSGQQTDGGAHGKLCST